MEDLTDMFVPIGDCPECGNSMIFRLSELSEGKPLNCSGCTVGRRENSHFGVVT